MLRNFEAYRIYFKLKELSWDARLENKHWKILQSQTRESLTISTDCLGSWFIVYDRRSRFTTLYTEL